MSFAFIMLYVVFAVPLGRYSVFLICVKGVIAEMIANASLK